MRLVMIRDLSGVETRFRIYDGSGNQAYRVTGSYNELGSRLDLWDAAGRKIVSAVQRNPVKSVYTVHLDGVPVLRVFRRIRYIYPCCRLFDLGWRVKGNLLGQEYEVVGFQGTVIFAQKRLWSAKGEGFELQISNSRHQAVCLGIAMVLNDAVPSDCCQVFVQG